MAGRRHQLIACLALLSSLGLAACATPPPVDGSRGAAEDRAPLPEQRESGMRPVSASLLQQSREQQRAGDLAQAGATLDRALRIDPGEPAVWLELARVRYAESNWQQAEQLARKARSLSPGSSALGTAAERLIADALVQQGRLQEARQLLQ